MTLPRGSLVERLSVSELECGGGAGAELPGLGGAGVVAALGCLALVIAAAAASLACLCRHRLGSCTVASTETTYKVTPCNAPRVCYVSAVFRTHTTTACTWASCPPAARPRPRTRPGRPAAPARWPAGDSDIEMRHRNRFIYFVPPSSFKLHET